MKNPGITRKLIWFISATALAAAVTVVAQPDAGQTKNHPSRARPQVIYHLPPSSNYAATLHSQAKSQNREMQIENPMQPPGQTSHGGNPEAPPPTVATPPTQERSVKPRGRSPGKSSGRGNGHGNHPHKK